MILRWIAAILLESGIDIAIELRTLDREILR